MAKKKQPKKKICAPPQLDNTILNTIRFKAVTITIKYWQPKTWEHGDYEAAQYVLRQLESKKHDWLQLNQLLKNHKTPKKGTKEQQKQYQSTIELLAQVGRDELDIQTNRYPIDTSEYYNQLKES